MLPVQVTIRDIPASQALDTHIRKHVEKLTRFCDRIQRCRVVVECPQKHKHQGKLYSVCIDVTVPGKELVINRKRNEDVYIALRDAFKAAERQLDAHSRKRHGHVKTHDELLHGHISRMNLHEGYGFIDGTDGNEYYFSVTNVSYPTFAQLLIGDAVEYMMQPQGDGHQAHHVVRERHNHKEAA